MRRIAAVVTALTLFSLSLTGTPALAAASWHWCSSNAEGTWHTGKFMVQNDAWNGGHGPQRICANSYHDVRVTSNQPTGNTAIETYPDVGAMYTGTDTPVSGLKDVYNTYTESFPADVIGEAADDIWLNDWSLEIMIWVDVHHEDPGSYLPVIGHPTLGGQKFTVYNNAPEYIFELDHPHQTTGSTRILGAIHWMIKHGYAPADSGITEAEFGWEIASTDGAQKFNLTDYGFHVIK
jgi:hypothetical protein